MSQRKSSEDLYCTKDRERTEAGKRSKKNVQENQTLFKVQKMSHDMNKGRQADTP